VVALCGDILTNVTGSTGSASNFRGETGGLGFADGVQASTGATGTTEFTGGGTSDYCALTTAFISDASTTLYSKPPTSKRVEPLLHFL
jgi:hypothetical protein